MKRDRGEPDTGDVRKLTPGRDASQISAEKTEIEDGARGNGGAERVSVAVGSIFRQARRDQKLSQSQVASLTAGRPGQISRAMVSLIERGHHLPGLEAAVALSRALHIEPTEIFERIDLPAEGASDLTGFDLEALNRRARECSWAGDYRSALTTCDTMLRILELAPPADREEHGRIEARIEIQRAAALRHCGALAAARTAAERAVAAAEGLPGLQARAYIVLASLLEQRRLRPLARDMARRAVELAEGQDAALQGMAWLEMGAILYSWSKFEEARRAFVRAGNFVRSAGDFRHEIHVEGNIGSCLLGLGRPAQARRRIVHAVELARKHKIRGAEAFWLVELGKLGLEQGRREEAEKCAESALHVAEPRGHRLTVFRAECLRYRIHQGHGNGSGSERRVARMRRMFAGLQDHTGVEEIEWFREIVKGGRARNPPGGTS